MTIRFVAAISTDPNPASPSHLVCRAIIAACTASGVSCFSPGAFLTGANPRAARHFGIDLPRLVVLSFLVSGFLVGLAAAADILGLWGYIRTSWNPAYGDTIIPFVFLARLNALAVVPFIAFFSVVSTGGDIAASDANLSTNFLLVLVGLILLFMTVIEYLGRRREFGASYLTPGLRQALRAPLVRRRSS